MAAERYIAIDLGAGSGRVNLVGFDGAQLAIDEVHRFDNPAVDVVGDLYWDVLFLYRSICDGLAGTASAKPVSLGVDTWGVDFALLDREGALLSNPWHYRDGRKVGKMAEACEILSRDTIFERTGLQFMDFNSLYQLLAMKGSAMLDSAETFLMVPDLFNYWLTGEKTCEFTDASTSQCYDQRRREWAWTTLDGLGLPTDIFLDVVEPGSTVGALRSPVAQQCGLPTIPVVAPGTHDTASAVAAVPASGDDWAYLSSGTWSLLGIEADRPHVTAAVLEKNFTNEGGVCRTTRLLKNICGLWLLEECRRVWSRQGIASDYDTLLAEAQACKPFRSLIDVDAPVFAPPGDMPARITSACRRTGQPEPSSCGEIARCIFESLALKYRAVLEDLGQIRGKPLSVLHVVGGGSQNALLCQYAADACGIPVVAGPVEATTAGNALMQAIAMGRIGDLQQGREVMRQSTSLRTYEPMVDGAARWQEAASRIAAIAEPV